MYSDEFEIHETAIPSKVFFRGRLSPEWVVCKLRFQKIMAWLLYPAEYDFFSIALGLRTVCSVCSIALRYGSFCICSHGNGQYSSHRASFILKWLFGVLKKGLYGRTVLFLRQSVNDEHYMGFERHEIRLALIHLSALNYNRLKTKSQINY